jgi:hypothetical protein
MKSEGVDIQSSKQGQSAFQGFLFLPYSVLGRKTILLLLFVYEGLAFPQSFNLQFLARSTHVNVPDVICGQKESVYNNRLDICNSDCQINLPVVVSKWLVAS